ncbi:DoxX family protein [Nonlabens mediterrranea]|uniref:DoxX family protein n=1 Tax=Nonlabens mediterrranea TaxID=1419947 RepID=A0ABS0A7A8_9FLAO|nr:DoxX family protein [Nonlabens mediterrranea]
MEYFIIALKIIVALSLLNVWLLQFNKSTKWRGGNAKNMIEEFRAYGLPAWMCYVVGFLKVTLSLLLLASIMYPELENTAAIGLALLLSGSISMHIRIKDPMFKFLPAAIFLAMCLIIALI